MTQGAPELTRERFAELVGPLEDTYLPDRQVIEHMGRVDVTTVSGPTGAGKTTLMRACGIPRIISTTTRPPREQDGVLEQDGVDAYFVGGQLPRVYEELTCARYVQWALHPVSRAFYGSHIDAYPEHGATLLDAMVQSVPRLRKVGAYFKSLASVYVVVDDFPTMRSRIAGRGTLEEEELRGRLVESMASLEQGLDDPAMHFLLNRDRDEAARRLALFAERQLTDDTQERHARQCGHLMLRGIRDELGLPQPL